MDIQIPPRPQGQAVAMEEVKRLNELRRCSKKWRSIEVQDKYQCKSFLSELTRQCMHPSMQMQDMAPKVNRKHVYNNWVSPLPVVYKNIQSILQRPLLQPILWKSVLVTHYFNTKKHLLLFRHSRQRSLITKSQLFF